MSNPTLVLKFASNYHMQGGAVAGHSIPVSEVRAIYDSGNQRALIVETIDGRHMVVTSREIEIGEVWEKKP